MAAVGGDADERLRHEAGEGVQLAPHLAADLAVRREVVGRPLRAIELEVQLELAGGVLVVALDHVDPHRVGVLDDAVDQRLQLGELVDVVAEGLRHALDGGGAVGVRLQPHHLGLGAGPEVEAGLRLELRLQAGEVAAAVGGQEAARILPLLPVAEAGAPDAGRLRVPRQRHEGVRLRDPDELRRLRPVADVLAVPVDEQVGRRAVDELEALGRHRLPVLRRDALAHDPARDGGELVVDVGDPQAVDLLADACDLSIAPVGGNELLEIRRHRGNPFDRLRV